MKNYIKLSFIAIAVMFLFNFAAVNKANAQINEILKRMDEHYKALTSLKANVMMDKYNAQLDEHDISEGVVKYIPAKGRDATVRIDWTKPTEEILIVKDKKYIMYRPKLKQAMTGNATSAQKNTKGSGLLDFMSMSKEQLRENYAIKYLGEETVSGGVSAWHLEMTPKTARSYKVADVWVDGNGMPIQSKITENNNDSTTILLSNLDKNKTINASEFQLKLPSDVTFIKN